ncbi:hypothetical protein NQ317_005499 [Molorchus minor]|uniref:Carboxylesterase type B domain-containing protein n=1 Tax=Molorchus minor TaxID=1323400 RepID=A0ABQ9IRV5_9CUCU|nr:hypothetical protein NQ317_005499 [Molorchus minor]
MNHSGLPSKYVFITEIFAFKSIGYLKAGPGNLSIRIKHIVIGPGVTAVVTAPKSRSSAGWFSLQYDIEETGSKLVKVEALPVEPWNTTRLANRIYKCLQYRHLRPMSTEQPLTGSEDCLYLNIYTPRLDTKANLDVIVFIHGGAFMFNYGGFQGPEILLDKNVVYVNFNYRLGPLGFLSTEDDVVPGNNGLKDQIVALKFIREHIKHFGGNTNSITLAGNSAGGASVHFHCLIKKSRGLFHKGLSQSGTVLNPWVLMEKPLEKTEMIASLLGCRSNKTKEMINCLKQRPGDLIVNTVKFFQPWLYNPFSPFGVVVDTWSRDPLLPMHPYELLKKKMVYDIPWLVSHVGSEGLYPAAGEFIHLGADFIIPNGACKTDVDIHIELKINVLHERGLVNICQALSRTNSMRMKSIWKVSTIDGTALFLLFLHYNETVDNSDLNEVSKKIRQYYFGNRTVNKETFGDLVQMISDRLFVVDINKAAKLHAVATTEPTYFYYFTYRGMNSRSESRSRSHINFGAAHGDDAQLHSKYEFEYSISFREPEVCNVNWTQVSKSSKQTDYLKISSPNDLEMEANSNMGHVQFWNSLPINENEKLLQENDCIAHGNDNTSPRVTIPLGQLEGSIKETIRGRKIYAFEGIPYAQPPEPIPLKPWIGIWKAKTMFKCMQYDHFTPPGQNMVSGDEDCLYVNVYTPNLNPKERLDVMVYIHGGTFMFNYGGMYGPEIILDREACLHLGFSTEELSRWCSKASFRFLSTEDDVIPGNNGLKDQILALKWVKENIEYFGGNPNSTTIMGMSAGGASVHLHHLLPQSQGLFHRGISQSGTSLNSWVLVEKPLEKTKKLASLVGCPLINSEEIVNRGYTTRFSPFAVVVDTWATNPLLTDHPYQLLKNKKVKDLPWITSYVSAEGLYPASDFYYSHHLDYLDKNWNKIVPYILHYNDLFDGKEQDEVSQKIRERFLQDKRVDTETYASLVELISDRLFVYDIGKTGRLHSAAIKSPVYSYHFTYRGSHSKSEFRANTTQNIGVSHGDDTAYVLKCAMDTTTDERDRKMTDEAKYFPQEWKPLSKNPSDPWIQLHIAGPDNIFVEEKNQIGNADFWNTIPFKENDNLFLLKDEL